ncbi:MAG: type II toxin-antitoxin system RelE/ParE family toxin [Oscillospiraceae bacterium]|jgi:addiction module RelE/StbE family toxin|nr:type II toxin-antitoxin system RelE/ParE family toxin [Oscillospiraceae bacterium]
MDVFDVRIAQKAGNDLKDIARYISMQLNAPTTALNTVRTIKESIAKLETNAFFHPLVRDDRLAAEGFRLLVIKNYIAFYVINEKEKTANVARILYARRDWQNIL